jgi:hypothetical protein
MNRLAIRFQMAAEAQIVFHRTYSATPYKRWDLLPVLYGTMVLSSCSQRQCKQNFIPLR